MKTKKPTTVIKRTISLSPLVNQWAEEMAAAHGYESNFSSFLADLVRRAHNAEAAVAAETPNVVPLATAPTILIPKSLVETKRALAPEAPRRDKKKVRNG